MAYALPKATRKRVESAILRRDALQRELESTHALIDAVVATVREALRVPDDYIIQDLDVGFVLPAADDPDIEDDGAAVPDVSEPATNG